jgi:hypothetical protein
LRCGTAPTEGICDVILRELQGMLARLYDAPSEHDVADFLITDGRHAAALQGKALSPPTDEQLLLSQADGTLELSLYVDASVLQRLLQRCPLRGLDEVNLADYCTALEGVSHFHYVVWSAGHEREVSLLELELQAEVDKYASALRLMLMQREGAFPGELHGRLFGDVRLVPGLESEERSRYLEAHRCAARFCRRLEERFLRGRMPRPDRLLAELRGFYRLGRQAKLRHAAHWS